MQQGLHFSFSFDLRGGESMGAPLRIWRPDDLATVPLSQPAGTQPQAAPPPPIPNIAAQAALHACSRLTLREAYDRLLAARDREEASQATISSTLTGLNHFHDWLETRLSKDDQSEVPDSLSGTSSPVLPASVPANAARPDLATIEANPGLLAQFAGDEIRAGRSQRTAERKLTAVLMVLREAHKAGWIRSLPSMPAVGRISTAGDPASSPFEQVDMPETVTLDEFRQLRSHVDVATWPVIGDRTPAEFWAAVLDCHWTYGFRSQDWFGVKTTRQKGLLWSQLSFARLCPIKALKGLESTHGWVCFWIRKKRQHLALPLSERVRTHIERFRGCDLERVFPNPRSKDLFYGNFKAIRAAARVDGRITLSGRGCPSLRKGCTLYWDTVEGGNLTSLILGHSTAASGDRAAITDKHYAQRIRRVVDFIEQIPF